MQNMILIAVLLGIAAFSLYKAVQESRKKSLISQRHR
ncbi:hypothetical protein EDC52_101635 [Biostraticola tofi]|uniref:Uncharacterized protein n=1 Tax=Biostraticola tofi TaxID=466109 RepID=A0A4V2W5L4_9GAMM|nr:hypothetical protein EDC52_101635 [Biostraticola tofi]